MDTILLVVLVIAGIGLVTLVLLQHGKGADAGAAFGGGGGGASGSVFGSQGSGSFMTKSTGVLAAIFFMCSLSLAFLSGQSIKGKSLLDEVESSQVEKDTAVQQVDVTPSKQSEADVPSIPSELSPFDAGAGTDNVPRNVVPEDVVPEDIIPEKKAQQ